MKFRARFVLMALAFLVAASALILWLVEARARRESVRTAQVHLERGIHLYEQKALLDAERELRLALRADPKEWRAPFYVGIIEIAIKRFGMALPYLERALMLNPTEPKILNALGVAYFKLGRVDMAKGYFLGLTRSRPR